MRNEVRGRSDVDGMKVVDSRALGLVEGMWELRETLCIAITSIQNNKHETHIANIP